MVKAVIFDLDNTLYPASADMEAQILRKMNEYVARLLGMSVEDATALRKSRMSGYGTTLEWLIAEQAFSDYQDYFSFVHPAGEESTIEFDPRLGSFLDSIAQPKYVFTNAPMEHAERVITKLGIEGKFERIFDIWFNGLRGKPSADAVDRVLQAVGHPAAETLFVDDMPKYVRGFVERGGVGILIDHFGTHSDAGLPTIRTIYELEAWL